MDPYIILGVNKNDDISIIKKKYKKLCLMYHPDKNINDGSNIDDRKSMFQIITIAYNDIIKEKYDNKHIDPDITHIMDTFFEKIKVMTEHPLYDLFMSIGIYGISDIITSKQKINNTYVANIDVNLEDLLGNCTIDFIFKVFGKNDIHVNIKGVYPFVIYKHKPNDIIVNIKLKTQGDHMFDHHNKILYIDNEYYSFIKNIMKQDILTLNTQSGKYKIRTI